MALAASCKKDKYNYFDDLKFQKNINNEAIQSSGIQT